MTPSPSRRCVLSCGAGDAREPRLISDVPTAPPVLASAPPPGPASVPSAEKVADAPPTTPRPAEPRPTEPTDDEAGLCVILSDGESVAASTRARASVAGDRYVGDACARPPARAVPPRPLSPSTRTPMPAPAGVSVGEAPSRLASVLAPRSDAWESGADARDPVAGVRCDWPERGRAPTALPLEDAADTGDTSKDAGDRCGTLGPEAGVSPACESNAASFGGTLSRARLPSPPALSTSPLSSRRAGGEPDAGLRIALAAVAAAESGVKSPSVSLSVNKSRGPTADDSGVPGPA